MEDPPVDTVDVVDETLEAVVVAPIEVGET